MVEKKLPDKPKQQEVIFKSVDWIVNQADKSYTLQLLAVSEEKGIKRFLQLHKIHGNLVVMETKRNGKPWFALLYGAYISRDEALRARNSLPATYKSSGAWPRSILSIRQAIQAK
jgi:DamX protein